MVMGNNNEKKKDYTTEIEFDECKNDTREQKKNSDLRAEIEALFSRSGEAVSHLSKLGGVTGVAAKLDTDLRAGVRSGTVESRRATFGKNDLPEEAPVTFWSIYKAAWSDHMILLLTAAALVSLVLGLTVPEPGHDKVDYKKGWIEGFAILLAVTAVTTASTVNDYRKELKFRKLMDDNSAQPIPVIRDGREQVVDVTEIVVGDVVCLAPGLVVPVDGLLVRGESVLVDESSVTGENDAKRKTAEDPVLLSGTVVNTAEDACMLACAVGESSFGGKLLMESRQGEERMTPLQERLDHLAGLIGRLGLGSAVLLFIILCCLEVVRIAKGEKVYGKRFLDFFLLCVTVVVVAVPEGLPLAVTIALAYSQNRMQKDNNQVRRLCACETMGNATQVCSDKTGTLTQNVMSVVRGYIGMRGFSVADPGDCPHPIVLENVAGEARQLLVESLVLNSSSEKVLEHVSGDKRSAESHVWRWRVDKGNKTDGALLDFADRLLLCGEGSGDKSTLPHQRMRADGRARGSAIFPFTSERKFMSTVVVGADGQLMHYVKGGSDRVLSMCDRYLSDAGVEESLTEEVRSTITTQIHSLANDANRTIGVAYGRLGSGDVPAEEPALPLVWLALLGIQDPLRAEVPEAVRQCQFAGVTVRMCTGDHLDTAIAIARQCGIYNRLRGDLAMTGQEFRSLVYDSYGNDDMMLKFWPVLERMVVMARSQPLDKQLLVLMLMLRGEVVAVTGDGTNDAPALRLANVGFVMRSGTDIAVKSADIVLLDDNFRSVQRAVVWGRTVNDNIRKFLQLQLTVNISCVVLVFVGSFVSSKHTSPLTTVQLLWVNLIMDTLAALALATEEPSDACLHRGPTSRMASLVSRRMWCTITTVTIFQVASTLSSEAFYEIIFPDSRRGSPSHRTFQFNVFVFNIIFHMFNARKLYGEINVFEGMGRSKFFVVIILFCAAFQILAVSFFGNMMGVTPLTLKQWGVSVGISFLSILVAVLSRCLPIREPSYGPPTDVKDIDKGACKLLEKLSKTVEQHRIENGAEKSSNDQLAQRLQAQSSWQRLQGEHAKAVGVRAFRRARVDRDMRITTSREMYQKFQQHH
ncbi:putative Cation transporter ATPase N terminus [Trypanosoma vivax]|nr:putative Cation transporter ATPase N terminus [Trypanosoma vivax]